MKLEEPVIRHSYEQTANRLARLALFAEAGETNGYTYEVTLRQTQLATDDTLNIAIACRRLIDALSLRALSLSRPVLAISNDIEWKNDETRPKNQNLHETINKIIHSSFIEIYCFSYQLTSHSKFEDAYLMINHREKFRISPLLGVRSDRASLSFCDLRDFCVAIDGILDAAQEAAAERKIFLGEF